MTDLDCLKWFFCYFTMLRTKVWVLLSSLQIVYNNLRVHRTREINQVRINDIKRKLSLSAMRVPGICLVLVMQCSMVIGCGVFSSNPDPPPSKPRRSTSLAQDMTATISPDGSWFSFSVFLTKSLFI